MTCENLTVNDYKVMWVVGALERLATLGLIGADIPLQLASDAVDVYMEIDEYREHLFQSDIEIATIFGAIAREETETPEEDIKAVVNLLLEYKNNRTEIVKYALSHQIV
jgi:hypothetical protein